MFALRVVEELDAIPAALSTDLRPSAGGYGSYGLGVIGEAVPRLAAGLDDVVVAVEDRDGELFGAQVDPDVLTGFSSGLQGGKVSREMLSGTVSAPAPCQPAPSRMRRIRK